MIRSRISKMVRSMVKTLIDPIDGSGLLSRGLLSRYFVKLDPVLNSYYEVGSPITFAGDFEIEAEFSTTGSYWSKVLLGDIHSSSMYFNMVGSTFNVYISGNSRSFTSGGQTPLDGKLHKIKYKLIGTSLEVFLNNISLGSQTVTPYTGANNFKLTDQSGASDVVTTFKLDNSPAANNYTYSTEILDNNTFTDNANARQYLIATKGWIITDGGAA